MGPYCPLLFSLTAQLPNQDVSVDGQTHLGAAQTQKKMLGLLMHAQSVNNKTQILCLGIIHPSIWEIVR